MKKGEAEAGSFPWPWSLVFADQRPKTQPDLPIGYWVIGRKYYIMNYELHSITIRGEA
jgi:hypothetical protein